MSGNQVGRRTPDGGKSKNNMSTHPVGGHNEAAMKTGRQETVNCPSTDLGQWCDKALQTAIQDVLLKAEIICFHYCIERLLDSDYGNPNN